MTHPPIAALPQLCGACQHPHAGDMTSLSADAYPPCPTCGCTQFRLHPQELAAGEIDGALEAAYFPHGTILDAELARGLGAAVAALEAQLSGHGWNRPPRLGCFYLAPVLEDTGEQAAVDDDGGYLVGLLSAVLDLRHANLLELTNGNPNVFVPMLADMARQRPTLFDAYRDAAGVDPGEPVAAWWVSWESWVRTGEDLDQSADDRPELARGDLRTVVCIDVDERVYEVNRLSTGEVSSSTEPWPLFVARVTGAAPARNGLVSGVRGGGPLLPVLEGLVRLVRHSCAEAIAGGTLREAGAADGGGRPQA